MAAKSWGYSSVGRAPALQAGGHEFESRYLHVDNEESRVARKEIQFLESLADSRNCISFLGRIFEEYP